MANPKKVNANTSNAQSFPFKQVEIPILKETPSRKNYYMTNLADDFFDQLIYYYESGNVHSTFVDNLSNRIIGTGLQTDDINSENIINTYGLNELYKRISFDYSLYGGYAFEVIWNALHTQITQINYLDFSRVRSGYIDDKTEEVSLYYYSTDWHKWKKEIEVLLSFDTDPQSDNRQIYYYKDTHPGKDIYPRPEYYAALKWVYTEVELVRYYANLVKNNFVPTTMLTVNSFFDVEKQNAFEKSLKQFTGGDAAGTIFVIYNEGGDETTKPDLIKFNSESEDNKYQWLSQHTIEELIIGHRIPNPMLAGVKTPGQLGGSSELEISERIYNLQVILPKRANVLEGINTVSKFLPGDITYEVINTDIFDVVTEEKTIE